MFTQQNRRGFNRPILRPLCLMTSAAANGFSVPGVNISHTLVGNTLVDDSDVFEASIVGAVPTTSSIST